MDTASEICFGMLCDIQIQWFLHVSSQKSSGLRTPKDDDIFDVELLFLSDRCDVVDMLGNAIGSLNKKTHLALSKLASLNQIKISGYIRQHNQQHLIPHGLSNTGKPPLHDSKTKASADFLLFGPQDIADDLAKDLSHYRLFLQHPYPLPVAVPYENPQYLDIAGSSFANGSILPSINNSDEKERSCEASSSQEDNVQQVTDIIQVLDHIPQHDYLKEVAVDERISTPLLSHQKEGVDFIHRREELTITNPRSLWKLTLGHGINCYHHLITGSTRDQPDDTPGGILADAMGVGKTLIMIAAITSSGVQARKFASELVKGNFPARRPTHATLILVPSALLLDEWVMELEKHIVPGALQFYRYHGPNRRLPLSSDIPYDIIMSTYGTVAADFRRGGGVLYSFKWYRLILDEAHVIRNWSTKQFKAVTELDASIRWCMTGTPIQNSLEDLASLVRFLKVPVLEDTSAFRRFIIGKKKTLSGIPKPRFDNLKLLLGSICLRRSTSVLPLLGVTFLTCRPILSPKERDAYNGLALACRRSIDEAISCQKTRQSGRKPIIEALLRMRIFCNLGLGMDIDGKSILNEPDEIISLLQQSGEAVCASCNTHCDIMDCVQIAHLTESHDLLCAECATQHSQKTSNGHEAIPGRDQEAPKPNVVDDTNPSCWEGSSKLKALLENIKQRDPEEKSIVFSFWIRSLDSVAKLFTAHAISFRRIDGTLPVAKRKQILSEFNDSPVRVLLMTLGTGAIGLNQLSIASQLHLLEPQWNLPWKARQLAVL
ncbi:SNF2 family N-terminal domain-containing protein [Hypoxylon sp. NC1633]|nr:SNF2 family N-terminal domain-containing protein [Hypoxylon sp. NC1633]